MHYKNTVNNYVTIEDFLSLKWICEWLKLDTDPKDCFLSPNVYKELREDLQLTLCGSSELGFLHLQRESQVS